MIPEWITFKAQNPPAFYRVVIVSAKGLYCATDHRNQLIEWDRLQKHCNGHSAVDSPAFEITEPK